MGEKQLHLYSKEMSFVGEGATEDPVGGSQEGD